MLVTQITGISNSRGKVYLDYEFAFVLYKGELRHYGIEEGEELSEENYDEIVNQVLIKRAKKRSMELLKNRPYTEKQLRDKLKQGFYPAQAVEQTISYLMSYHYLDDLQYAGDYIAYHCETRSRRRIEMDLMKKGIDKEDMEAAFASWEEAGGTVKELDQIQRLMIKRNYDINTQDRLEKQKMAAFLFRKGFSQVNIKKALNGEEIWENE